MFRFEWLKWHNSWIDWIHEIMKFDMQYCQSNCLHELSWYIHDHNYMNMTWYELFLSKFWNQLKLNVKKHEDMLLKDNEHVSLEICQIWAELFYMLAWKWDHEIFAIMIKNIEKAFESKSYADSWSFISEEYHDLIDVFEKQHVNELSSHQKKYDIEIELKSEKNLNFRFLYSMSWKKLQVL